MLHSGDLCICSLVAKCACAMGLWRTLFLFLQVDGQSHVVHSEEEALGTRLTIDSLTCLMANETDPSRLLAISPGKLMRYLVPDESHVLADQPYAEIEVRMLKQTPSHIPILLHASSCIGQGRGHCALEVFH